LIFSTMTALSSSPFIFPERMANNLEPLHIEFRGAATCKSLSWDAQQKREEGLRVGAQIDRLLRAHAKPAIYPATWERICSHEWEKEDKTWQLKEICPTADSPLFLDNFCLQLLLLLWIWVADRWGRHIWGPAQSQTKLTARESQLANLNCWWSITMIREKRYGYWWLTTLFDANMLL
jgi:hypothetical protein